MHGLNNIFYKHILVYPHINRYLSFRNIHHGLGMVSVGDGQINKLGTIPPLLIILLHQASNIPPPSTPHSPYGRAYWSQIGP